jgi:hypothetical protein
MDTLVLVLAAVALVAVGLPLFIMLRLGTRMRRRLVDLPQPGSQATGAGNPHHLLSDAEWADVVRHERHMWLNHMQVISGWLQLDNAAKAGAYVQGVVERMQGLSQALRKASPPLVGLLVETQAMGERHGVRVEVRPPAADSPLLTVAPDQFAILRGTVLELLKATAETPGEEPQLHVALRAAAGGGLVVRLESNMRLPDVAGLLQYAGQSGLTVRAEEKAWELETLPAEGFPGGPECSGGRVSV